MSILDCIQKIMRHPVRFEDNGAERCLTLDEAAALIRRVEIAIKRAHAEIKAGPIALPICSRCNDTHEMPAWNGSGATWPCTGCPRPCDKSTCRTSACAAFCDVTPCACECHADDHMYQHARAKALESNTKVERE